MDKSVAPKGDPGEPTHLPESKSLAAVHMWCDSLGGADRCGAESDFSGIYLLTGQQSSKFHLFCVLVFSSAKLGF